MNTSNIIIALEIMAKRNGRNLYCHSVHHSLCMASSEKSENKYSNISIALLFSSPTKNEPRSHAALTLAQYFY